MADAVEYARQRRQVFEPPQVKPYVVEHQIVVLRSGCCGQVTEGPAPEAVRGRAEYGPMVKAAAVYGRPGDRQAIAQGRAENKPDQAGELTRAGKLVERFARHRNMILRYTVDLAVPFTNNQAERDLRPVKVQQNASATWRTLQGLTDFATLRSYLSTAAKHGKDALEVLRLLLTTDPWLPPATAVSS